MLCFSYILCPINPEPVVGHSIASIMLLRLYCKAYEIGGKVQVYFV